MGEEEACWDAFGSDDDSSDSDIETTTTTHNANNDEHPTNECMTPEINSAVASSIANDVALHLTQTFLTSCPSISLSDRCLTIDDDKESPSRVNQLVKLLSKRVGLRGIKVIMTATEQGTSPTDAAAVFHVDANSEEEEVVVSNDKQWGCMKQSVVPGGWMLVFSITSSSSPSSTVCEEEEEDRVGLLLQGFQSSVWAVEDVIPVYTDKNGSNHGDQHVSVWAVQKREGRVNSLACPWKNNSNSRRPSKHRVTLRKRRLKEEASNKAEKDNDDDNNLDMESYERHIIQKTTIGRSAYERSFPRCHANYLCDESLQKAARALSTYGFVVIRDLFEVDRVMEWGNVVLSDLDAAVSSLEKNHSVNLLEPGKSADPVSYRELAMREDLRVDLRNGPAMENLRQTQTQQPPPPLLQNHPSILQIIQTVFNPTGNHFRGNFGRWNFNGNGPDGSPQPLSIGNIASVVSLPGCADQAIHADTPHLFEHLDLPPHYANLFIPATPRGANSDDNEEDEEFTGDNLVGGTAFIAESHKLGISERIMHCDEYDEDGEETSARKERLRRIIRPSLITGDALIFDCRVLHFGLANCTTSSASSGGGGGGQRRPMLYVNYTHGWFTDPKNWDNRERLFSDLDFT